MIDAKVEVFPTTEAVLQAQADSFVTQARAAIGARGRFVVALAGGTMPQPMHALIALPERAGKVDWHRVHLFFGDERGVPPDHERSNFGMAQQALLSRVPVLAANVHRIEGERDAEEAARRYEAEILALAGEAPRFDLVHLGLGEDGHTASLFPGHPVLRERSRWVAASYDEANREPRVTFTVPLINLARRVEMVVVEAEKAPVVQRVLEVDGPVEELPARALRPAGEYVWMCSAEAAARLTR